MPVTLSRMQRQAVEDAVKADHKMVLDIESDPIITVARTERGDILFAAGFRDAFDEMWRQAVSIYNQHGKKVKEPEELKRAVVLNSKGETVGTATYVEGSVKELSAKEIATKLYGVLSKKEPHGSKKLAAMAGIPYSDKVLAVLKKLRELGKVEFDEGRWTKA